MKRITILALQGTAATTVTGPHDIFSFTGVAWNCIQGIPLTPQFEVEIVSPGGKPVVCHNNLTITPHRAMEDVEKTDLIIISTLYDIDQTLATHPTLLDWLINKHQEGAMLASVCTGSFILAETGLLDGKIATTHWGMVNHFRARYPKVILKPERLITDAGTIFCSGAFNCFTDLSIYLVEKMCGWEMALECAKTLVHDVGRSNQTPYSVTQFQRDHNDGKILTLQTELEKSFSRRLSLSQLTSDSGMSRRNLERRFKAATGDTPLMYLQRVRVEKAKSLLEQEDLTFAEITNLVGYEDASFFSKIFARHTGLRPSAYRSRFTRSVDFQ